VNDLNRPLLGDPNAPCRTCGAPLASDQRYCLQCGARRAEARLPFLDILARQVPSPPPAAVSTTTSTTWLARMSTNAAAVAGVACLLLALGVGVLIGGLGQDDSTAGASPQVISVGGGAAAPVAAAATAATPAATATTTPDATTTTPKATKKSKSSTSSSSKATNNAVEKLGTGSGGDYSKKSAKLPKTLGTGGKAPPVDKSKPVGGGSDVESIG
jgi:cell division septation protein DedD